VVDETSACLSIAMRVGLNVNHKDMNKFSDREGPYDEVKYCLQRIYDPLVKSELTKDIETYQAFTLETTALGLELSDPHPNDVSSKEQGNVITNTYEEQSWLTSLEWNLGLVTVNEPFFVCH
jgi:hypothetical protein